MVNTGELIKKRRKELGINAVAMAEKLGVHHSTIYRYEKGDIEKMPTTLLSDIAKILDADPAYFMGLQKEPRQTPKPADPSKNDGLTATIDKLTDHNRQKVKSYAIDLLDQQEQATVEEPQALYDVRAVSRLAAGFGYGYDDHDTKTVYVEDEPPRHDVASLVEGDSMTPDYEHGNVVYLVDRGFSRFSGQVCAVVVDDETFIKKVYTEPNGLRLVSINPAYPDRFIDFPPSGDTHIKIFSVVGSAQVVEN